MYSNLPVEIYQVIIDFITEDAGYSSAQQMRDLCACCLVCKSFVPLCQRHIFAHGCIGVKLSKGHTSLPSALRERPELSTYMKHLVYVERPAATENTASCMFALMNLPQLQRLDLWCEDTSPDFGRDVSKPFGPGQFFKHYISSGTLTTLSFYQIQFLPIYDVLSAVNLIYLQIRDCGVVVEPDRLPASTNLRLLDIEYMDGFSLSVFRESAHVLRPSASSCLSLFVMIHLLSSLLCVLSGLLKGVTDSLTLPKVFPDPRKLRVSIYVYDNPSEDTRTVNRIFETTRDLECLEVEADFQVFSLRSEEFPLHIQQCVLNSRSSLKRLDLYLTVHRTWFVHEGVYDVLSAVSGQNVIEEVEVVIFFAGDYVLSEYTQKGDGTLSHNVTPTLETWSKLDELLDGKNMFPCLRKISVLIVLEGCRWGLLLRHYRLDREEVCEFRQSLRRSFHHIGTNPNIRFNGDLKTFHGFRVVNTSDFMYEFPHVYKF